MGQYRFFAVMFLAGVLTCPIAYAEDMEENSKYLSISIENDNFGGNSDRYYTSGVRATWFDARTDVPNPIQEITEHIPTFDITAETGTFYSLGHNMYTPADVRVANQPVNDRPWAAFLYGSVGLANVTYNDDVPNHIDELEFTLGVVGPEALGKPIQRFVHSHITGSPKPRGWKNQLNFEPGVMISWQRRMPYAWAYDSNYFNARIEPNFNITVGNIRTHAGFGGMLVIGSSQDQDTPPRVRPAVPGTGVFMESGNIIDWQVFAGAEGRAVARDIFLDGNTFTDSHSVDKRYFVGDLSGGFALSYDDYRLAYTLNWRSKEFKTQAEESIFGSLTLTKRF
ncbi:MAG: lipid A deacylase LpxR family protein [Alphaproteobacteria bacterium]